MRNGSTAVAEGHTSGGTVGQWRHVGKGEDESGRTTVPDDLWGNEEVEQISFMSVSLTRASPCVRGVTATNYPAQVQYPPTSPPPTGHTCREPWDFPPVDKTR